MLAPSACGFPPAAALTVLLLRALRHLASPTPPRRLSQELELKEHSLKLLEERMQARGGGGSSCCLGRNLQLEPRSWPLPCSPVLWLA